MLSVLIWLPVVGALVIGLSPMGGLWARRVAMGVLLLLVLWMVRLGVDFDFAVLGYQFEENLPWLDALGLRYRLGMDGLAYVLLGLNVLLTMVAVYATEAVVRRPRLYYALLMLINAGVAGAFVAQNVLLFFLCYEVELIPLYLLIAIWGGQRREYAAMKFLLYTAVSGILLLAVFLGLAWLTGAADFDYQHLVGQALPVGLQIILLGGLLLGFGIKIPLVPLHTWLPDAHVEASTPVSVLLAGVLLKLGTYGLLRFGLGLFPMAWQVLAPGLAVWAAVSALYGALLAIAQTDMKKMVAYSSIAHMAYVLLAAAAATPLSLVAAMVQMVSHGLISALLFLMVGMVYRQTGTRSLKVLRGLLNPERGLPLTGAVMILGVMASAGIPGMVGFVAEFLVFRGSFEVFPIPTIVCMVSTGLTAVYFLLLVNRVFFGRLFADESLADELKDQYVPTICWKQHLNSFVLTALVIVFGLVPSAMTLWMTMPALQLAKLIALNS